MKFNALNISKRNALLLAILAFAFSYRVFLLFLQTYPPGADIGFHASVIHSITQGGNTNFLYNYYQMGGEIELEFPGFHIFTAALMFLTALPTYVAQALVVATFSALTALAVFLVARVAWNETVAVIAAFLVTVSPTDIEILCWGGAPNIMGVFLIPATFYLFLKREKFTSTPYLASTSLLVASIFLTHSLSAAIFVAVSLTVLLAVLVLPKVFGESRKTVFWWLLPMIVGTILVSPFLYTAIPIYLRESAILTSSVPVGQALQLYRTLPVELVLALSLGVVAYFVVSKLIKGRFFNFSVFLLIIWLLVPLLLTQGQLVGVYVDPVRFPFFLMYPLVILFTVMIDFAAVSTAEYVVAQKWKTQKLKTLPNKFLSRISAWRFKRIYIVVFVALLLVLLVFPVFRLPWEGAKVQAFYQVMDSEGYQAIEWAKQNTPEGSVFVSDMGFGWWLGGFGQRPTITNTDLQAISLAGEVDISRNASFMLDTSYVVDNGYIQVREDGYLNRHNPLFMANVDWSNKPVGFFQCNSSEVTLLSRNGDTVEATNLDEVPITSMELVGAGSDSPSIVVNRANSAVQYTETVTVTKGTPYANMTITIQSSKPDISLDGLTFVINAPGATQQSNNNTLAIIDQATGLCEQLTFEQNQPTISNLNSQNPCITQLSYNLEGKTEVQLQIQIGIAPISEGNTQNPAVPDLPLTTFDYKQALRHYNVSYVVNQNFELNPKYALDPAFSLVFINSEVAIYRFEANSIG